MSSGSIWDQMVSDRMGHHWSERKYFITRKSGGSRYMTITKYCKTWRMAAVTPLEIGEDHVILHLKKIDVNNTEGER